MQRDRNGKIKRNKERRECKKRERRHTLKKSAWERKQ